ncbi:MAG TPA: hypothetical protein DDZ76_09170 [Xanthomonadales bacterium]|nr:hypothetical protein [Xanthomonadales bacterium]
MSAAMFHVLPLLTIGFLFNILCYRLRYRAALAEGQRLFFMSAATGMAFGFLALLLRPLHPEQHAGQWLTWLPGEYSDVVLVAALAAAMLWPLFNFAAYLNRRCLVSLYRWSEKQTLASEVHGHCRVMVWLRDAVKRRFDGRLSPKEFNSTREWVYSEEIERNGTPLQRLVVEAFIKGRPLLFSLKSRKVYCGLVFRLPPPRLDWDGQFIEIIPMFSACREKENLTLQSRLDYVAFNLWRQEQWLGNLMKRNEAIDAELLSDINELKKGYLGVFRIQDWAKIMPIAEIETASIFDENAPEHWFNTTVPANQQPPNTTD